MFDNSNLIAACIVGDGEAETGPLATSWQCNKFLNPGTDGAVLPILHLKSYKISNPTVPASISHEELEHFFDGCGWKPRIWWSWAALSWISSGSMRTRTISGP